jgi:hypothetical protein
MCSSATRRVLRRGLKTVATSSTRQSEGRCNLDVSYQGFGGGGGVGDGGFGGGGPGCSYDGMSGV